MRLQQIALVFMTAAIFTSGCTSGRTQTRTASTHFSSRPVAPSSEYDSDPPVLGTSSSASMNSTAAESQETDDSPVTPVPPAGDKVTRVKGISLSRLLFRNSELDCADESPCANNDSGVCDSSSGHRPAVFDWFCRSKDECCPAPTGSYCAPEASGCVEPQHRWSLPTRLHCPEFAVSLSLIHI